MSTYPYIYREPCASKMVKLLFFMWCSNSCAAKECQVPNETEMHGFKRRAHTFFYYNQFEEDARMRAQERCWAQPKVLRRWTEAPLSIIHHYTQWAAFLRPGCSSSGQVTTVPIQNSASHVIRPDGESPTKKSDKKKSQKNNIQNCETHRSHSNNLVAV